MTSQRLDMARPTSLSLTVPKRVSVISSDITSPTDAESNSPPLQGANQISTRSPVFDAPLSASAEDQTNSPELTSLPPFPSSPKQKQKHAREPSKGFFSNLKASKSSQKVFQVEPTIRQVSEEIPRSNLDFTENSIYSLRKSPDSTPDLSLTNTLEGSSTESREDIHGRGLKIQRRPVGGSVISEDIVTTPNDSANSIKPKPRFGTLLQRSRSTRVDDTGGRRSKPTTPVYTAPPDIITQIDGPADENSDQIGPKTAPLQQDFSIRDTFSPNPRNRSADRQVSARDHSQENMRLRRGDKPSTIGLSAAFRESIKNTSTTTVDSFGKAGKRIFGKISRSVNNNAREEEPARYVCKVINLPLIEQARHTRIAPRLAYSKDKTEYWLPALPYRCIDYLQQRGIEEEGLFRIPGSEREIREWKKRFDQEGDIDLFKQEDLNDINIIGSLFKAWLRELPTELLPKATQDRIAYECQGPHGEWPEEVPQLLKDELSRLPPQNYYLLFATTCLCALLVDCADKSKMTYTNLCICFQPALRIEAFCFSYLVKQWKYCWQDCWTEKQYEQLELRILYREADRSLYREPASVVSAADSLLESSNSSSTAVEERSLASASSNVAPMTVRTDLTITYPSEDQLVTPTRETHNGSQNGYARPPTPSAQLPELAPMMPLSPIGHFN